MLRDDLDLVRDVLLHDGVPVDPEHPRRMALNAIERSLDSLRIEGTPSECGSELFLRFVLPAMRGIQGGDPKRMVEFYGGMLMTMMGAMEADFGHALASSVAKGIVGHFADMGRREVLQ